MRSVILQTDIYLLILQLPIMRFEMNKRLHRFIAIAMTVPALMAGGCHNHETHGDHDAEGTVDAAGEEHHHDKPGIIHLEPADAARYGVAVEVAAAGEFHEAVRVAGEILPSTSDVATASARTSGIVSFLPGMTRGATVKAGQQIARINSKGMTGGDSNTAARVAVENAKRELDRLTPLLADGLITRKEYNDALAAYNSAAAAYSPAAANGTVTAPRAGVITDVVAPEGAYVDAGAPIALISGNGSLTLRALLPASEAEFLPRITGAVITPHGEGSAAVDLAQYGARLLSTSAASSTETPGYIPVYFSFSNAAPVVSGSAAEVYLTGGLRHEVISVPMTSVAEQMGEKFIFVKRNADDYEKLPVRLGRSDGKRVEVVSGIVVGDSVVTGGVSFVRLAEQSTVVPEGHSHNH